MGSLDRRLARLEGAAGWSLTRILEWIAHPSAEAPSGPLADCLNSLPTAEPGVLR